MVCPPIGPSSSRLCYHVQSISRSFESHTTLAEVSAHEMGGERGRSRQELSSAVGVLLEKVRARTRLDEGFCVMSVREKAKPLSTCSVGTSSTLVPFQTQLKAQNAGTVESRGRRSMRKLPIMPPWQRLNFCMHHHPHHTPRSDISEARSETPHTPGKAKHWSVRPHLPEAEVHGEWFFQPRGWTSELRDSTLYRLSIPSDRMFLNCNRCDQHHPGLFW